MFVLKKKNTQQWMAGLERIKVSFYYLGGYFVAIRALYLIVNRRALRA